MVGATRFELATFRSRTERSTKLSHAPRVTFKYTKALAKCQRKLRNLRVEFCRGKGTKQRWTEGFTGSIAKEKLTTIIGINKSKMVIYFAHNIFRRCTDGDRVLFLFGNGTE